MTSNGFILVVDDDDDVRDSIRDALEDAGYHVDSAANGKEALRLLKEEGVTPEVILLDMMMPEMDGWAFRGAQRMDPAIASIPVILFTAYGVPNDAAEELGAVGVLRKPLRLQELLSALSRAVNGGGAR